MRSGPVVLIAAVVLGGAACGGDDDDDAGADTVSPAPATTGTPATTCAEGDGDPARIVTLRVDDLVDGFGSIGSRVATGLTAGTVRLEVEADEENEGPVDVVVAGPGGVVATISGVAPGTTCAVDADLAAGEYVVTSSANPGSDSTFAVVD